jgi:hypothetical protein
VFTVHYVQCRSLLLVNLSDVQIVICLETLDGRQSTGRRKAEENTRTRRTMAVDNEAQAALRVGMYCNTCVTGPLLCMACPISG